MNIKTSGPDELGSAYIYFNEHAHIKKTKPVTALIDIDANGVIVGVELLDIPDNVTFGE